MSIKLHNINGIDLTKISDSEKMKVKCVPVAGNDIAIIGMSCKFAGANNVNEYWDVLKKGKDCIRKLPIDRKVDVDKLLSASSLPNSDISCSECGYLNDIDKFDCSFFGISPREADLMDPYQRLFLETAWGAIEEGGYGGKKLAGSRTGIFVGYSSDFGEDYKRMYIQRFAPSMTPLSIPSNIKSIIASRIAYLLDFKGPSLLVDTACSSSLVAVHLACQSLIKGECDSAIAGGVKISLIMTKNQSGHGIGIESSVGRAKTFDDNSDGTGFGEGVAALLLKPLRVALSDGDIIHAVIKGSAMNQDGRSVGITAPNPEAQEEVILAALKDARLSAETITYIEAHGTGTKLGDPIEINGIQRAFRKYTNKKQFCAIGSVKTNIGHLDNASGIAGLIKAVMALKNKQIPPSINFNYPNRKISFEESPVYVNDRLVEWKTEGFPRRCGVSAFGLSGTNCHIILEESPDTPVSFSGKENGLHILALSANSKNSLEELVERYKVYSEGIIASNIESLCCTANTGRGHFSHRLVILFRNCEDLKTKISMLYGFGLEKINHEGIFYGEHRIVSDKKDLREAEERTAEEQKQLSGEASIKVKQLIGSRNEDSITEYNHAVDISRLYVKGANIDWGVLYKKQKLRKVSLPIYPFKRKRCWIDYEEVASPAKVMYAKINYPLLDFCVVESKDFDVYSTEFNVEKHWVINEHKVNGTYIAPGTVYLDIGKWICKKYYSKSQVGFRNVLFVSPLIIHKNKPKEVQAIIKKGSGVIEFSFMSKSEFDDTWILHAQGEAYELKPISPQRCDLDSLKQACSQEIKLQQTGGSSYKAVDTGAHWDNIKKVFIGNDEVLAYLENPIQYSNEIEIYNWHPSLMDNAVNVVTQNIGKGLYLPLSYKDIKFYGAPSNQVVSYLKKKGNKSGNDETYTFDILLMNKEGVIFAELVDFTIKKVHEPEIKGPLSGQNYFYEVDWVPSEISNGVEYRTEGITLVFKNEAESSELNISGELNGLIDNIISIEFKNCYKSINSNEFAISGSKEDFDILFKQIGIKNVTRIIFISDQNGQRYKKDAYNLGDVQEIGLNYLFNLTKSLIDTKTKNQIEIVLIADNAYSVTKDEVIINPHNAALFGMGRVISQEYSNIICKCIDIDEYFTANQLVNELGVRTSSRVAYRNKVRYTQIFKEAGIQKNHPHEFSVKSGDVYIITGGLGGLGLEICKSFSSISGIKICLINRTEFPEQAEWEDILANNEDEKLCCKIGLIKDLIDKGSEISIYNADVSHKEQLEVVLQDIRDKYGKINGIIHCAGVAGKGLLINKEIQRFNEVIHPKMRGTWLLDQLTENDSLDIFVMFSSITALTGGAGQADYTAANAYLDSYSAYRNKKGKRTISIDWAPWMETGMAFEYGVDGNKSLFRPISTSNAINAFYIALSSNLDRVLVGEINFEQLSNLKDKIDLNLSERIKAINSRKEALTPLGAPEGKSETGLKIKIKGREQKKYTSTEIKIARIWCETLGLKEINVYDNYYNLGGDSIIAVSIVNNINNTLSKTIEVADIFNNLTINELASYIDSINGKSSEAKGIAEFDDEYSFEGDNKREIEKQSDEKISENINVPSDIINTIGNITWRQMNCYDRAINVMVGIEDKKLVELFKLFLGMERAYDLKSFGYEYEYSGELPLYLCPYNEKFVEKFGFITKAIKINDTSIIHDIICSLIDKGKLVTIPYDEYYCFYSPAYMKSHTNHMTIINGYDKKKKLYSIINHTHLSINSTQRFSYGQFFSTFDMIDEIYNGISDIVKYVIYLEKTIDNNEILLSNLNSDLNKIFNFIEKEQLPGRDIELIYNIFKEGTNIFDSGNFPQIYTSLGGKELFLETLPSYFKNVQDNRKILDLCTEIIMKSSKLTNSYTTKFYKQSVMSISYIEKILIEIKSNTAELFSKLLEMDSIFS